MTTDGHETPKPVAMIVRAVKSSCKVGEPCTTRSAVQGRPLLLLRNWGVPVIAMEIEPKYAQVAIERWNNTQE